MAATAFHFTHDSRFYAQRKYSSLKCKLCEIVFPLLSDTSILILCLKSSGFTTTVVWILSPNQLRRPGGRGVTAGTRLCVRGCLREWGSITARGRERERGRAIWTRWSSTNKPPRGCRVVSVCTGSADRPWCPHAARDPVPPWHWSSSWDAAWFSAARTTRSPSCWKGSVSWCATRTPLRTGSLPHLAYQSAPLAQRWLSPPCVEPTTSHQIWATRLWPSTLTRSDIHWIKD